MTIRHFDFAVIGGGPAGAAAARRLALGGAAVVVFERQRFPRPKPCGGGLSGRAMRWLDEPLPPDLVDAEIFAGRSHFGPVSIEVRQDRRVAVLVTRARFDAWLLARAEAAGAHLEWQEVRDLRVRPGGIALTAAGDEFVARAAVVGEGANRRFARAIRGGDSPRHIGFCVEADIPVPPADPYAHIRDAVDIYFGAPVYGYSWIFHHGSYYSVGVGGLRRWFGEPVASFRRFVGERGLTLDGVRARGHFVPCGGVTRQVAADRVILAGDAAGWVDPFQGEGMAYAVRSGQLAAETLLDAARQGDFTSRRLAAYRRRCDDEFGRDLRAARVIMHIVHRWPSLLLRSPPATERVLGEYLRVPRGDLSYRDFLRWVARRLPWFVLRTQWRKAAALAGPGGDS